MLEEYEYRSTCLERLTMQQVAQRIYAKDNETARKWLSDRNIEIHKETSKPFVYQVEVDCELDRPFVISLKNKHPDKWKEIYRGVVKDLAVYNLQLMMMEEQPTYTPTTKVIPNTKDEEKIYKDLLG